MLTDFEEVKHITFAHYGGMGGNGTWLSPFAFSWRLRAAVPFALIRNTEKQKYIFKRKMLTEEEVKHIVFGGMSVDGTCLSPFALSYGVCAWGLVCAR